MRILVTGGAGFIGSHYVRTLLTGGYPGFEQAEVTVLDKLTYAGNLANLDPVAASPRFAFVHGDICDAALLGSLAARPRRGAQLRRRDACRPVDRGRGRLRRRQRGRRAGPAARPAWTPGCRGSSRCPPTRCTAASPPAPGPRTRRSTPNSPYAAAKAGGDLMARAYARTHGLNVQHHPVLQQLRALPVPGEGHPAVRHQPARRASRCRSTATAATSATGSTWTTTAGASSWCWNGASPAGIYHINGDAELTNRELTAAILDACGAGWDMVVPVDRTARATTAATRSTTRLLRARGLRPADPVRRRPGHRALVRGEPRLVGAAEAARAARAARRGGPASEPLAGHRGQRDARPGPGRAAGAPRARRSPGCGRGRPGHHRRRSGRGRAAAAGRTWWSTARPGPRWTTPKPTRTRRSGQRARGAGSWPPRAPTRRRPGPAVHRLRVRRPGRQAVRRGRTARAAHRVRPDQAGRRAGRARLPCRTGLRGAHRLAVRCARAELRPDHDRAGPRAAAGQRRRRPARPADLDGRCRRRRSRAGHGPGAAGASTTRPVPAETTWFGLAREVFRLLGADPARVEPTTSSRLPAAGAAAGLQRARSRGWRPRVSAHRRLAGRARRALPGCRWLG